MALFVNPKFKVYVVEHMKKEKEQDGKLRAFMFVENHHLKRLWAFEAIGAEINILH